MATFIIGTIVFGLLVLAIYSMIKGKKESKGSCGCNCSGCDSKSSCASNIEINN